MKRLNKNGFTLIELLAVLILLAIVMGFGSYSIIEVLNKSREKDYELLVTNINSAVEEYYIECKYAGTNITCPTLSSGWYYIKLSDLVSYGYLKGNSANETDKLLNPRDNVDISNCRIKYSENDGEIKVLAVDASGSCPNSY